MKRSSSKVDLYARLDELRISGHEREQAKARLARAEAMVDFLAGAVAGAQRLLKRLVLRPIRRLAATLG
jgi:hypothetical protein